LILTIFLLLRIELGALCVGVVPSAAHRGTRLSHPRWGQSCWIGHLRAAALRPARLCDTHPFHRSLFGFSPTEIVEEPEPKTLSE
jgi:hypothetical protein